MMRKNSVFILLLVALLSLPTFAFADASTEELSGGKGVGWQGIITSGDDTGLYGVVGRARNKYNMACWVMGKNPLTIADEVRSKLSDPNYGGRFYEYANTFESIPSWDYVPEWQPTYTNLTYVLYGFDFQWESAVSQSLYEGAKEDFRRILAGEDLGGGGDNVSVYTAYSLAVCNFRIPSGTGWTYQCRNATIDSSGNVSVVSGTRDFSFFPSNPNFKSSVQLYLSPSYQQLLSRSLSSGKFVLLFSVFSGSSAGQIYLVVCDSYSVENVFVNGSHYRDSYSIVNGDSYWVKLQPMYCDGVGPFMVSPASLPSPFITSDSFILQPEYAVVLNPSAAPDGDWPVPDTPVTPTAPEIPTPTAPTVTPEPTPTEPTPTWPVIPNPTAPTVVTVVTPEGLDYTQLLTLINDNLNDINSYTVAINSSLNSLRSDLVTEFDGVTQGLRNIYQYLQHLDDLLERHCKHLRDALDDGIYNLELYVKSLFEWLPQQLDFDAKFDYDDTTVTSLLRRILGKIPGGTGDAPTSYMPNPQADEPGFFDWLLDLWHRFLIDLVSVLPDELGGLVDAFSQLTHYFPFSIPWDLAAMLALFEHEPVTPVFDVPWGFGGDDGEIEMVRVDLSAWDGVMEMVRPVFLVGFCFQLALITKDLLSNFDINKGGV